MVANCIFAHFLVGRWTLLAMHHDFSKLFTSFSCLFTFFRMFPSLVNCCTIDWFTEWPEDALEKVATKFLEDMDMDDEVIINFFNYQIE